MNEINFEIQDIGKIDLSMDVGIKEIYPPIEDLEVIPSKEQQIFTHENSYGYDNVTVEPIPDEYIIPDGTLSITENTTYDVTNYARVSASVHPTPNLQDKEVTPNRDTQTITSDYGYDGLNEVKVNPIPNSYIEPSGTLPITENGTYDVRQYAEVITNIESSGGASFDASTLDELEAKILELTTKGTDGLCKMHDVNDPYINTPVTLYTPLATHKYYFIRYRNGGYQIVWAPSAYLKGTKGSTNLSLCNLTYAVRTAYGKGAFEKTSELKAISESAYRSNNYSTFEECITAIQSPSTTYVKGTVGDWPNDQATDELMTPCTNCACYWRDLTPNPSRRISKDETIEVIS